LFFIVFLLLLAPNHRRHPRLRQREQFVEVRSCVLKAVWAVLLGVKAAISVVTCLAFLS